MLNRTLLCLSLIIPYAAFAETTTNASSTNGAVTASTQGAVSPKKVQSRTSKKYRSLRKKQRVKKRVRKAKRRARTRRYPTSRPKNVNLKQPKFSKRPFPAGERLHFDIMMFGQLSGETILAVGEDEKRNGRTVIPMGGFLRGSPFLNKFYPIENSLHVWLDPRTYQPQLSEFSVNENHKKMTYTTRYNQKARRVSSLRIKKNRKMRRQHKAVAPVYEPLGCIYAIRAMKLTVGDEFNYYLFDGRKERLVNVKVLGEEDVSVPAGLYRAKKIAISTKITGGFVTEAMLKLKPRRGTIWIANDEARTPLKMIAETKLGPAEALLTKRYFEKGKIQFN